MKLFYPLYISNEIIITYGIHPFNICSKNPQLWEYIKISYIVTFIFSNLVYSNFIYTRILTKFQFLNNIKYNKKSLKFSKNNDFPIQNHTNKELKLLIGCISDNPHQNIYIPENGLYQNFLITGTIGSGKTSSAMYPFTKQLL